MRRLGLVRLARGLSVLLALSGVGLWFAPQADGLPPLRQGWWSQWQQPTAVLTTLPGTVPPPPGSEPGGLTIARDAGHEQAVAAIEFRVDVGADATMYLDVAPGHQPPLPPGAVVHMCLATSPWVAESNGVWAKAPSWGHCEVGVKNQAQDGFVFTLSPWMQSEDGAYNVVIVPGGTQPFVLNFAATSDTTIVPGEAPTTTTTAASEPEVEETDPIVVTDIPGTGGGDSTTVVPAATTTVPARTPTSLVAFDPRPVPRLRVPGVPDSRMERIMAVSVLFFIAVALWWLSGSQQRMPRLVGALAGGARPAVTAPVPARGVGRFARARDGLRPPRL